MIRRQDGFTLIELIITLTIFVMALAAASTVFTALLSQFKQQSKIAQTSVEGIVGLEMLRQDIESAGVGLPWTMGGATYGEAAPAPDSNMNDSPANPPIPVRSLNNVMINNSDMLAVKSVSVGTSKTAQRWTEISCNDTKKTGLWGDAFVAGDHVITLTTARQLVALDATHWSTTYGNTAAYAPPAVGGACDQRTSDRYVIYGVDPNTNLRMPFNRADYYIKVPASLPKRCAPGTGVLYKAVVSQLDGTLPVELPLLDCVMSMRVLFMYDPDINKGINITYTDNVTGISTGSAADITARLKEVRVYILAQDGQIDPSFTYPTNTVALGSDPTVGAALARNIDLTVIPQYQNYRWKQYNLIVRTNLGQ